MNRGSSVGTLATLRNGILGNLCSNTRCAEIFVFSTLSIPSLGSLSMLTKPKGVRKVFF